MGFFVLLVGGFYLLLSQLFASRAPLKQQQSKLWYKGVRLILGLIVILFSFYILFALILR